MERRKAARKSRLGTECTGTLMLWMWREEEEPAEGRDEGQKGKRKLRSRVDEAKGVWGWKAE